MLTVAWAHQTTRHPDGRAAAGGPACHELEQQQQQRCRELHGPTRNTAERIRGVPTSVLAWSSCLLWELPLGAHLCFPSRSFEKSVRPARCGWPVTAERPPRCSAPLRAFRGNALVFFPITQKSRKQVLRSLRSHQDDPARYARIRMTPLAALASG